MASEPMFLLLIASAAIYLALGDVREAAPGRRIFGNLQKALGFIFSIQVPIAGLALVPLIFDWPLPLTPVHIVFLELIIDPACSIAFEAEPEEADLLLVLLKRLKK